jgi:hypothetical protein
MSLETEHLRQTISDAKFAERMQKLQVKKMPVETGKMKTR